MFDSTIGKPDHHVSEADIDISTYPYTWETVFECRSGNVGSVKKNQYLVWTLRGMTLTLHEFTETIFHTNCTSEEGRCMDRPKVIRTRKSR